ncbi:MAG: hypothetical protein E6623_01215 [Clostridium perfringens]|uniref:hypothetical protein n=3 Tax=Clostridium perfringens TaxID=1502 RepID=UPI000D70B98D|nr:hypothetical protein [Clostridium perfringens]MBO3319400.1 hypothetical protein [Clostridium perfringens]MBO3373388.1 hypothetical protein [Clostridium perfringens]MDK0835912.1 hypothetical protein [Clostridium perfringens]MDU1112860.1 hypothetical protein [Clostridium perfringens]MDU1597075.1 hypothetical protein [Clostridium perfringens]
MKKNINKIPKNITDKIINLNNPIVTFGYLKISKEDILQNKYSKLRIKFENNKINYKQNILPDISQGKYSKYNINGKVSGPLKHLPKIPKSYSYDAPNFGDPSKGYHTITINREVWQRKIFPPKFINLIFELEENHENELFIFKVFTDSKIDTNSETFEYDLLFNCNLLQENIGNFDITDKIDSESYIDTLYVNWEILPPGESSLNLIKALLNNKSNKSNSSQDTSERMLFFKKLGVKKYIRGTNSFNSYIGAIFDNDVVLLENSSYGNAAYILKSDWQTLSKLSRTELLSNYSDDIIRIPHNKNWKNNLKSALLKLTQ